MDKAKRMHKDYLENNFINTNIENVRHSKTQKKKYNILKNKQRPRKYIWNLKILHQKKIHILF